MILSVHLKAFQGDAFAKLESAADAGFEGVELRGDVDGTPLTELTAERMQEVARAASDLGLQVSTLALGPVERHAPDSDGLKKVAALAAEVGARIRLFSSNRPEPEGASDDWALGEPDDDLFDVEAKNLAACVSAIQSEHAEAIVAMEAEPISVANTVERQARLFERAETPSMGFNWDVVNCWMGGEYPWPRSWKTLEGRLFGVHIKGAKANPLRPWRYASQALPGQDDLPHQAMFVTWLASGFNGPITVDPHYNLFAETDHFAPEPEYPDTEVCLRTLEAMKAYREMARQRVSVE